MVLVRSKLGILFESTMKWNDHVNKAINESNSSLLKDRCIRKESYFASKKAVRNFESFGTQDFFSGDAPPISLAPPSANCTAALATVLKCFPLLARLSILGRSSRLLFIHSVHYVDDGSFARIVVDNSERSNSHNSPHLLVIQTLD